MNAVESAHEQTDTNRVFNSHLENIVSLNSREKFPNPKRKSSGKSVLMIPVDGVTRKAVYIKYPIGNTHNMPSTLKII